MEEIELTHGYRAMVDDEDYDELIKHKWYAEKGNSTIYAARTQYIKGSGRGKNAKYIRVKMHHKEFANLNFK